MRLDHLLSREWESELSVGFGVKNPPRLIDAIAKPFPLGGAATRSHPSEIESNPAPVTESRSHVGSLSLFKCSGAATGHRLLTTAGGPRRAFSSAG